LAPRITQTISTGSGFRPEISVTMERSRMAINYHRLIDQVMTYLNWQERWQRQSAPPRSPTFRQPYITIERDPGSGGRPIAQLLAEKLNFSASLFTESREWRKLLVPKRTILWKSSLIWHFTRRRWSLSRQYDSVWSWKFR
jgi:hypothetical protein